jgi:pyridoxamine 5'-phosphate oxidase
VDEPSELRTGAHRDLDLDPSDLGDDPIEQFRRWYAEAEAAGIGLPNAIALATADPSGAPSVRHVLLRSIDDRGVTFFTNRESRKGRDLAANPLASFAVYWRELDRQVCVSGTVEPLPDGESDAYFATRPREARIGAWASRQSRPIADRADLMRAYTRRPTDASPATRSRGPRTGAATGWSPTGSSSGRAATIGCTTG